MVQFKKAVPPRWLPVKGYEDLYEVCDLGFVRRSKLWKSSSINGLLRPVLTSHGYMNVSLSKSNRAKSFRLHGIVADAFLGPRPTGYGINHIDGNKTNNRVMNLEYVTPKENTAHAIRTGLFDPRRNFNEYGNS